MSTYRWLQALRRSLQFQNSRRRASQKSNSHVPVEQLEARALLVDIGSAIALGEVSGVVFGDNALDGLDAGDTLLSGVDVHLYRDGGNGVFESNAGFQGGDDVFIGTDTTGAAGDYQFSRLSSGTYFVEQEAPPAGFNQETGSDVATVVIDLNDQAGTQGLVIDNYNDPVAAQIIQAEVGVNTVVQSSEVVPSVLGGTRDMEVEVTSMSGNRRLTAPFNLTTNPGAENIDTLEFTGSFGSLGRGEVSYDGDNDASVFNPTGLGGVDLTENGDSLGLHTRIGSGFFTDAPNLIIRIYTDGSNVSEASVAIPNTGGTDVESVFFDFATDFAVLSGTGADFTNVGGIEIEISSEVGFSTVVVDSFNAQQAVVRTANLPNFRPMTLGGELFRDDDNSGARNGSEAVVSGAIALTLFEDTNGNGTFDSAVDQQVATATASGGNYSFANLAPGDYIVGVDASNFNISGPLDGLQSSTGNDPAPDPDDNVDGDDNGTALNGAIFTQAITLVNNAEPDTDGDTDTNTNFTVDFGLLDSVDIALAKTDNVDPVTAGSGPGNLVYTVTASNSGPLNATGVVVTDEIFASLPTGWTLVSGVGSGGSSFNSNNGQWTIGNLDSGDDRQLTLTFTVDSTAVATTTTNTVRVTNVNESDDNPLNDVATEDTTVVRSVDITVTKNDNVDPVTAGSGVGNLVYSITASNIGDSDATAVTLTDELFASLPTGWSLVSAVGTGGSSFNATNGLWTIGNLASSDSRDLTLTFTVDNTALSTTTTNTVRVTNVAETETNTNNNVANEDTTVARLVDITVTKDDNVDPVTAGSGAGNLIYTITATNNGPSDATSVTLTDELFASLPTGWTLVSGVGTGGSTFNTTSGVWTIGNLANTDSRDLTLTFTVDNTALATTTTNTVRVTNVTESESNVNNNVANEDTTVVRDVDITVTKSDNVDPVTAGSGVGNLVYSITASNLGVSDATSVTLTDELFTSLPTGWSLVSGVGTGGSTFNATTGLWTIGNLAGRDTRDLTLTFTVDNTALATTTTNTVRVTNVAETESNTNNNVAIEDTTVVRDVDITVTKNDNVDPVTAGSGVGNLVYTITASNIGDSDSTNVTLTDELFASLPTGWSLVSAIGSGGSSFNAANGLWTIGNLASNDSRDLTLTFTVDSSALSTTTTNTVRVTNVAETETNTNNNVANEDTTVVRLVDITVDKNDNVDPVTAGSGTGNLVYSITATNNGPSNATNVGLTDELLTSLPTGWTLVSGAGSGGSTFNANSGLWTIGDLASGDDRTLDLTFTVDNTALETVTTNVVRVTGVTEPESNTNNNTATEDTRVVRNVDIQILKDDSVDPVTAGSGPGNLTYTVTAENIGTSDASGVEVTDSLLANLPVGWSIESIAPQAGTQFDTNTGIWTIGDLSPSTPNTLTVVLTVGVDAATGITNNVAELSNINETDSNPNNNSDTEPTEVIREVDIVVLKDDTDDPITAGSGPGNLIYTITAANNGPSDATNVQIEDALIRNLPTGWSFVSGVGTGGSTFNEITGIWDIGSLDNGDSRTLTLTLTVGPDAAGGITTTNTATLSNVTETDTDPTNNSDSEDTMVVRSVDINLSKIDFGDPVTAGSGASNLTYRITANNSGTSDATGVVVLDEIVASLPTGFSVVSGTGSNGTTFNSNTGLWTIGDLGRGESRTLDIVMTVDSSAAAGSVTNTATVNAVNETDSNPTNDTASEPTQVVRSVDIGLTKTDNPDPVTAGSGVGNLVYTITATNNGPSNASNLSVADALISNLPTGVTLVSAAGNEGSTFNSSNGIWSIGDLANGDSRTLIVTVTVDQTVMGSTLSNTVEVQTLTEPDPNPDNDTETEPTQVLRAVDIIVQKTDSPDPVSAGSGAGNLLYTVTATNDGPSNATGVTISDAFLTNLPSGVTLVNTAGDGGTTFNATTGIWDIGDLASGDSRQLLITLTVDSSVSVSTLTNTASLASVDQVDTDPNNNSETVTTAIDKSIDLVVTKTDRTDPVQSPGTIIYDIVVGNNGPSTATNVTLTDVLSSLVVFDNATTTQGQVVHNNGTITGLLGDIPTGSEVVVQVTTSVDAPFGETINNIVTVEADQFETDLTNNTDDEVTVVQPEFFEVSGTVYQDLNNNGIQDTDELPISGALVGLFGTDGQGNPVTRTAITDANGGYLFEDLLSGTYNLFEVQPRVFDDGLDAVGTGAGNVTTENDAFFALELNSANGNAAAGFNFGEGQRNESKRDFIASNQVVPDPEPLVTGENGTISGRVVADTNGNGTTDDEDTPIFGAAVTLAGTSSTGDPIVSIARTNQDGEYRFIGVPGGTYSLLESQPFGFTDGPEEVGTIIPDEVLDDVFAGIVLPEDGAASGFNFLEQVEATPTQGAAVAPVVAGLLATSDSNSVLRWEPIENAVRYEVWVSQLTDGVGVVYNEEISGTQVAVPAHLELAQHRMWVRGISADDVVGPWSSPTTFTVTPPITVTSPTAGTTNSQPVFEWNAVAGADSYELMISDLDGQRALHVEDIQNENYTVTESLDAGSYQVWVRPLNGDVIGDWSDGFEFSVTDRPTIRPLREVSSLAAPMLEWDNTGADSYRIWMSRLNGVGGNVLDTTVEGTSVLLHDLEPGGTYRVWVQGIDATGRSNWSEPVTFTVNQSTVITSPIGAISSNQPTIIWEEFAGAFTYDLWVSNQDGLFLRVENAEGNHFTFPTEIPDGQYRVWVKPQGPNLTADWSASVEFNVGGLQRPELITPQGTTANQRPTFVWSADSDANRTELWVNQTGGQSRIIHETDLTGTSYTASESLDSGAYTVWVRSRSVTGEVSAWSLALRFSIS